MPPLFPENDPSWGWVWDRENDGHEADHPPRQYEACVMPRNREYIENGVHQVSPVWVTSS